MLISELIDMTEWLDEQEILSDIALDYRIKSLDSIIMKYDRYYPDHQTRKVFNDILGFRAFCDNYEQLKSFKSMSFRVADMTKGKATDDGYRGVHVYYQKSSKQIEIGKIMRDKYEKGVIHSKNDFEEALKNVLSNCERSGIARMSCFQDDTR